MSSPTHTLLVETGTDVIKYSLSFRVEIIPRSDLASVERSIQRWVSLETTTRRGVEPREAVRRSNGSNKSDTWTVARWFTCNLLRKIRRSDAGSDGKGTQTVLLLPTVSGWGVFPGEHASVRNQDVEPRDFLLNLIAEFVYGLELGKVNETKLDILKASCRLDIYSPC